MINDNTFNMIIEIYYQQIYNYCNSAINYDEQSAMDITQDVFLFAYEKRRLLENTNIKSWLYSVAKNKIHEYFRNLKKEELTYSELSKANNNDEYFDTYHNTDTDIYDYLNLVLHDLSDDEKVIIRLRFVKGKKYKDIANELNMNERTIQMRCSRLLNRLKKELDNHIMR